MRRKVLTWGLIFFLGLCACEKDVETQKAQNESQETVEQVEKEELVSETEEKNMDVKSAQAQKVDIHQIPFVRNDKQSFQMTYAFGIYNFATYDPEDLSIGVTPKYVLEREDRFDTVTYEIKKVLKQPQVLKENEVFVSTDAVSFPDLDNNSSKDYLILETYKNLETKETYQRITVILTEDFDFSVDFLVTRDWDIEERFKEQENLNTIKDICAWIQEEYEKEGKYIHKNPTEQEQKNALAVFEKYINNGKSGEWCTDITEEERDILLKGVKEVEKSGFLGKFQKTKTLHGIGGDLSINKLSTYSAKLDGDVFCYAATGVYDNETLYYLSETKGFFISSECEEEGTELSVAFLELQGEELYLVEIGSYFCMGMGVSGEGYYTKGTPEYTDDHIVEETFTPETIAVLKKLFEEHALSYEQYIEEQMLYGACTVSDVNVSFKDGSKKKATNYSIWVPHAACQNVEIYQTEDGHIYMTAWNGDNIFMTDDARVTTMPEEVQ